jgi:hypothetical protein
MAILTNIERLNYYEGEYLGAVDFDAEQEYHRDMRRRHNVGQHTWGIVAGLELAQVSNGGPNGEVAVFLMPGMAVDGFGREILALSKIQLTQDPFAPYYDPNAAAKPRQMYLWIAYDQAMVQASQDTCATAGQSNAFGRVQESYRIAVTPDPTSPIDTQLTVDGTSMSPGPPATPPAPGDIVLPADGSAPYQEFSGDDTTLNWFIPIGTVLWDPHNEVFVSQSDDAAAKGRLYAGSVTQTIYAPGGALTIVDRMAPFPLPTDPNDPNYPGVAVEIAGSLHVDRSLQVDGLVNALINVLIGAKFDPTDKNPLSPLTIAAAGKDEELIQFRTSAGRETWHICENLGGANPGINFSEIVNGQPVDGRLFIQSTISGSSVPSTQNIGVGTLTPRNPVGIRGQGNAEELLSFEDASGATRWHVNHNLKGSFLGVPFTRGLNFSETNVADFRLFLQAGGNVGIGTPLPQQNLSVNGSLNIDQGNGNAGVIDPGLTFGSTSGEGIASKRSGGGNQYGLDFYTDFALRMSITNGGRVGIGTSAPDTQVHLTGGNVDLTNTEGDLKIGNPNMRLKMGVSLGGGSAGDARIRAHGGSGRLMIGSGTNDTITIQGPNVGINTIAPAMALDVGGDARVGGGLEVNGNSTLNGAVTINGNLQINGWLSATGSKAGYVADRFIYRGSEPLERGDVVALHHAPTLGSYTKGRIPLIEISLTDKPGDTCVCGIVDEPVLPPDQLKDLDMSQIKKAQVGLMVTLGAYSFCKVDASEAGVKAGDLLTTGSTKGHAVRSSPKTEAKAGAFIGKALAPLAKGKKGIIPILVSHQ